MKKKEILNELENKNKFKCAYCSKKCNNKFCSKKCGDENLGAMAINSIKGGIMKTMRDYSKNDIDKKKIFLEGLITCLKFDLQELKK